MKGLSFNAMRIGDVYEFEVLKPLEKDNFRLKDLSTLEEYNLHDLVQFGKGKDFEVREIE